MDKESSEAKTAVLPASAPGGESHVSMYSGTVTARKILCRSAFTLFMTEMQNGNSFGELLFHPRMSGTGGWATALILMTKDLYLRVCILVSAKSAMQVFVTT